MHLCAQISPYITFDRVNTPTDRDLSSIASLFQDSKGFIWIGQMEGVTRYDGYNFDFHPVFNSNNEKSFERILQIYEGSTGAILARGDRRSLYKLDHLKEEFHEVLLSHEGQSFNASWRQLGKGPISQDWAYINEIGLVSVNFQTNTTKEISNYHSVFDDAEKFEFDEEMDRLWVLSDTLLYIFDKFSSKQIHNPTRINIKTTRINDIFIDSNHNLWIGGYLPYVIKIDYASNSEERFYYYIGQDYIDGLNNLTDRINAITEDRNGTIWVGANGSGLYALDSTKTFTHFQYDSFDPLSIPSNSTTNMITDLGGAVWIATWGAGIAKYDPFKNQFENIRKTNNTPSAFLSDDVGVLYESELSNIWISTSNGIEKFAPATNEIKSFSFEKSGLENVAAVYSILNIDTSEIEFLVSSSSGLFILNTKDNSFKRWVSKSNVDEELNDEVIYFLFKTNDGDIYAISYYNYTIWKYNPINSSFSKVLDVASIFPDKEVFVAVDNRQQVWMNDRLGNVKVFDTSNQNIKDINFLAHSKKLSTKTGINFVQTSNDSLSVICTKAGIFRLHHKKDENGYLVEPFHEDNEKLLFPNAILQDDSGNYWVSCNTSLIRIDQKFQNIQYFNKTHGIVSSELEYNGSLKSKKSPYIYFGGSNGIFKVEAKSMVIDTTRPKIQFLDFSITDNNGTRILNIDEHGSAPIVLTFEDKVISASFSSMHFTAPSSNKYKVRLLNFEKNWRDLLYENSVTYTSLRPGKYVLQVKSSNNNGIFASNPIEQHIIVYPPWWRSNLAYITYFLLAIALFYTFYSYRLKRQIVQNELTKEKEINALKSRIYANITHEFKTPLTIILGLAKQLKNAPKTKVSSGLDVISRNGQNLLSLINQMLDLSKIDANVMGVHLTQSNVVSFITNQMDAMRHYASSRDINIQIESSHTEIIMDFDREKLDQILSNLLSNAIKFSNDASDITVRLDKEIPKESDSEIFTLEVVDQGQGIPKSDIPHLFDRFYRVDDSDTQMTEGTGLGLSIVHEMTQLLKGEVEIQSKLNQGTTFKVTFPISNKAPFVDDKWKSTEYLVPAVQSHQDIEENESLLNPELPIILVIEDNDDLRSYIKKLLHHQYRIIVARNGEEGVNKAFEVIPDIIISDVMMPKKNGFDVCLELKSDIRTSHIPFILLTARGEVEDRIAGISRGADVYLAKPFDESELSVHIINLLEQRKRLHHKYQNIQEVQPAEEKDQTEDEFIVRIKTLITNNLDDNQFGIEQICKTIGISRMQLHRKLKALTDLSTSIFIRNIRLEKAYDMLSKNDLLVSEVAYQVGFDDPKYFSRLFIEKYQILPNSFKKKS